MSSRSRKQKSSAKQAQNSRREQTDSQNSSNAQSVSEGEPTSAPPSPTPENKKLKIVVGVLILWWIILGGLALLTANPVVFSEPQIQQADLIVLATISSKENHLSINREWKFRAKPAASLSGKTILLKNLPSEAEVGQQYLIPLSESGNDAYRITQARLPAPQNRPARFGPPLIYPATEDSLDLLETLLKKFPQR